MNCPVGVVTCLPLADIHVTGPLTHHVDSTVQSHALARQIAAPKCALSALLTTKLVTSSINYKHARVPHTLCLLATHCYGDQDSTIEFQKAFVCVKVGGVGVTNAPNIPNHGCSWSKFWWFYQFGSVDRQVVIVDHQGWSHTPFATITTSQVEGQPFVI